MDREHKNDFIQNTSKWMKENKAIIVSVLLLILCFGILDKIVIFIDNTLLHITDFERNMWLDWLFVLISLGLWLKAWESWIKKCFKKEKIIAARTVSFMLIPIVLYSFFRFSKHSPYQFASFWDSSICYLDPIVLLGIVIIISFIIQQYEKQKKHGRDKQFKGINGFNVDSPIDKSEQDLFNMDSLVKRIVNNIAYTDVKDRAFSIGLVGEWGDGKTSLMNLIEEEIQKEQLDFILVHFNPRASKKADFIQEDFLDELKQSVKPYHSGIDRAIDKYAIALDIIPDIPLWLSKLLELFHVYSDKRRENNRERLKNAINDLNRRIIVIIDDLDRLTGEELIEVMKVIDTNGAFPNMVFLTAYDKFYVNTVLNNYLKLGNQKRDYTEKYFSVEINVPLHPSFRLMDYFVKLLTDACLNGLIKLNATLVDELTRAQSPLIIKRLKTIRDVKRFVNQFLYDYAEIQNDVKYSDYLLLELIKFVHPDDYEAIYRFQFVQRGRGSIMFTSINDLLYLNEKLLPPKTPSGERRGEPQITPQSIDILKRLFPDEDNYEMWTIGRYQRICSVSSFEHYFYNYEYQHLKNEDFKKLYKVETLSEVCRLIDNWSDLWKDMETYLLTRKLDSIRDKNTLRRFNQILFYISFESRSTNYLGLCYSFLRKEDVGEIIQNCGFGTIQDYIIWFKNSMQELTSINALIPSNYIRSAITGIFQDDTNSNLLIMSLQDLQDYALELLNKYLIHAGGKGWDANTAYLMALIQGDKQGNNLQEANKALHDTIVVDFHSFSSSLPLFIENIDSTQIGFNNIIQFNSVFGDKEEFEKIIFAEENNSAIDIALIRAIWPLFKANGYKNRTIEKIGKENFLKAASANSENEKEKTLKNR